MKTRQQTYARAALARPAGLDALEPRTLFAAPTVVDVLVVYDADAKAQLGVDDAGIQKLIRQSVESANQVHYNTQDNVVLRLVHAEQVAYSNDGGSIGTDLGRLQTPGDGFLDNVHALRDAYGADLVSLVSTPGGSTAGLASLLDDTTRPDRSTLAFSVLQASALGPGSFVLAHETGHNLGAGHERDNVQDPTPDVPFPYAYGYHFVGNNGVNYADVMSYQGLELPYFANPNLTYQGQPLGRPAGDPNAADLYSTFLQTAPLVAGYRPTVVPDTTAPAASLYQADVSGNVLTFTVRYADDVAVNAATLDADDVYVRTPEGFNLSPALVSVDRAGDGYAKLVTYRSILPASNPPVSSLGFFLRDNQVRDVNNNTAPGGAIPANADFDVSRFAYPLARDTGTFAGSATRQMTGGVSAGDMHDMYKFTLTQTAGVSVKLSGLAAPAEIFLMQDLDGNDLFGGGPEQLAGTPEAGNTTDRWFTRALGPGTYYVLVQIDQPAQATDPFVPTPYTLTVRTIAGDTTPPTATLDAVDTTVLTTSLNFSVIYADDQELDPASIRVNGIVGFVGGGFGGSTASPDSVTQLPDGRLVASYTVNLPTTDPRPNGLVTLSVHTLSKVKDASGNPLPIGAAIGTYRLAGNPLLADTTAPTVALNTAPPVLVPTGTRYDFVVAYKDNRGIDPGTLDGNDLLVTGPGGFAQAAQFVSSTLSPGGAYRFATYRITPPGGSWDWRDDGTFTLALQPAQVTDTAGNAVAAGTIGTFTVHAPFPGDANGDDRTNFSDLARLAQNYNTAGKGYADGDFNFDGVVNFSDLALLAQVYNRSLATPAPVGAPPVSAGPSLAELEAAFGQSVEEQKTAAALFSTTRVRGASHSHGRALGHSKR